MANQQLSTNTFGVAKWIVSATASDGTHTTIASALTSASSGDTIFIRPGTYTENLTLKVGVNLTAFGSDSSQNQTGKVIISGKATLTAAGSVTISGIQLQTNSDFLLAVTGTVASVVNLQNCNINCTNNTGISYTSSSATSVINLYNCSGDLGTTGIAIFAQTSIGQLTMFSCFITNTGASSTASTISAGTCDIINCVIENPVTSSSTSSLGIIGTWIETSGQNATALTIGGSGNNGVDRSKLNTGSASSISIGANNCLVTNSTIGSTNTNAITGAGTVTYSNLSFTASSSTINTTTQTNCGTIQGSKNTAPAAGFLGEQITANATSVATTSGVAITITSISLTAGIWDISGCYESIPTGGTAVGITYIGGISATNNTITGTVGINYLQSNITTANWGAIVPLTRVTLTTTTTYYLVVENFYTSTTCPTNGKITATRVG